MGLLKVSNVSDEALRQIIRKEIQGLQLCEVIAICGVN